MVEEVAEERLPAITRFPPRSAITPTVQVISSVEETTKKISVKRPSLDLVDSHSFNRGDKNQSKGSRVVASEFDKSADLKAKAESSVAAADDVSDKSSDESTTAATEAEETTTQVMDKVALDLYAHLANENSNVDSTTQVSADDESATNADSTEGTASTEEFTTAEATTIITTTTSTTTTTPAPTTTTTTTTEAPQVASGRRAPYGSGRNRFKSRPTARPAVSEIPVEVREASPAETSQVKPRSKHSHQFVETERPIIINRDFIVSQIVSRVHRLEVDRDQPPRLPLQLQTPRMMPPPNQQRNQFQHFAAKVRLEPPKSHFIQLTTVFYCSA